MDNKYDVFISYSTVDKLVAEAICGYLESHRVRCFIAYRDIAKGEDWAQAIPPAIRTSGMMLAVFSKAFNLSEQTDNELHIAARRKIPILTFRLTDDDFDGAKEYFLIRSNWIDAFPEPEKQFGELLRSVALLLGREDVAPAAAPVQPQAPVSAATQDGVSQACQLLYNEPAKRDPMKAVYLLRKAAREGSAEAEYQLGQCCWNGWGTPQSWNQAREWLAKAAEHGHPKAMYWLGRMHHYAIGGKMDIMRALQLYAAAAEAGDGRAMKALGTVYHSGDLGVTDEERSRRCYEQAFDLLQEQAFEHDDTDAMRELAYSYLDGEGVERDAALAVEWLQRAAARHDAEAVIGLYICYDDGDGVPQDRERALELVKLSADMECRKAQNNLALRYGEQGDHTREKEYRLKAANGGNVSAQSALAVSYHEGWEPYEKNPRESERWYDRAIEGGSLTAMVNRGVHYENGDNPTDEDQAKAVALYKQAALLGYPTAWVALGNNYYAGRGVEESDVTAEQWYRRYLDFYEENIAAGRQSLYVPSGQGDVGYTDLHDDFGRALLVRCCENLARIYRYSDTVEHNEREADRLDALAQKMKDMDAEEK